MYDHVTETIGKLRVIAPELDSIIDTRYETLKVISNLQPIGRRNLSVKIGLTERVIRKEAMILKDCGLVEFTAEGMTITSKGEEILKFLRDYIDVKSGIKAKEAYLRELLGIRGVKLVKHEEDEELCITQIGRKAAQVLAHQIKETQILGLTGGSTMHSVVEAFSKINLKEDTSNISVVSARGGLGSNSKYQSNILVERMAKKLGSSFDSLFMPDALSEHSIETLLNEPIIKKTLEHINEMDTLIFGIGQADILAKRRNLDNDQIEKIVEKGAVAEAFGYYFNKNGDIVHEISTMGISLAKFKELEKVIAVAGGGEKSEAIVAICKLNQNLILVTDEKVADKIIQNFKEDF